MFAAGLVLATLKVSVALPGQVSGVELIESEKAGSCA